MCPGPLRPPAYHPLQLATPLGVLILFQPSAIKPEEECSPLFPPALLVGEGTHISCKSFLSISPMLRKYQVSREGQSASPLFHSTPFTCAPPPPPCSFCFQWTGAMPAGFPVSMLLFIEMDGRFHTGLLVSKGKGACSCPDTACFSSLALPCLLAHSPAHCYLRKAHRCKCMQNGGKIQVALWAWEPKGDPFRVPQSPNFTINRASCPSDLKTSWTSDDGKFTQQSVPDCLRGRAGVKEVSYFLFDFMRASSRVLYTHLQASQSW